MKKRLDALLSSVGYSRKESQILIRTKRVAVNDIIINSCSYYVSDGDRISVDNKIIETNEYVYLMMNKPAGYVCTTDNTEDSVLKLIPREYYRKNIAPVGRLDKDSEGLLLLSNDGQFIHEMISPNKKVKKTYYIETEKKITREDIEAFKSGIVLSDGTECLPASLSNHSVDYNGRGEFAALVEIYEGKYHQVKRMIASRNNRVTRLVRIKIGQYSLDDLEKGEVRIIQKP